MSKCHRVAETVDIEQLIATEARDVVQEMIADGKAVICPCCDQFAMKNSRKITPIMARQLRQMVIDGVPREGKDIQASTHGGERMYSLLRFWGFLEKVPTAGCERWQATAAGASFVKGETTAALYAYVYNNQCVGFSQAHVTFDQAITAGFELPEVFATDEHLASDARAELGL